MPGFQNDTLFAGNVDFTGNITHPTPQVTADGQLLIGATVAPNIRVGTLTSLDGSVTITPTAGSIDLSAASVPGTGVNTINTISPDGLGNFTLTPGIGINITAGVNSSTIASSGVINYTPVNFLASPYTVLATDYYIGCDPTGGAISLLFPDAPTTGRTFIIKDSTGQAGIHNITVTTVTGTDLFDGSTSYILNLPYQSITIVFNGTGYEVI